MCSFEAGKDNVVVGFCAAFPRPCHFFYFLNFPCTHHTRHDTLTTQLMEFAPPGTTKEQVLEMYMKFSDREQLKEEICKLWDGTYFIDLVVLVCLSQRTCVFVS